MPRESKAKKRERADAVFAALKQEYPDAHIALDYTDPWQLLVATILSAQCTDERVNQVTPELFRRWPGPAEVAVASRGDVEAVVRPTGFFRNKAKSIQGAAQKVVDEFGGKVPQTMDELLTLPGVARKTANVVLHEAYDAPAESGAGIVVDTHVTRLSNRLRFVNVKDPVKIERELMQLVPDDEWGLVTFLLIEHGRRVCVGRTKPKCDRCAVATLCPSAFSF